MRLVFMGTPDYAVPSLKALTKEHDIVMVYTQPDRPKGRGYQLTESPVKQAAAELGLTVHQPVTVRSAEEIEFLKSLKPDVIAVIAYGPILPQAILDIPRFGCINAHGSILPKYRGASPMQQAILNGDALTGVTTMLMDAGMDTGDILLIDTTELSGKSINQLHDELAHLSARLLVRTLDALEKGELSPQRQDEAQASYTKKIHKSDGLVQWDHRAEDIYRQWLAYRDWPGLATTLNQLPIKLTLVESLDTSSVCAPGTVIQVSQMGIDVATGQGVLRIKELQPAGKRRMVISDYLRGNPLKEGIKLGE